MRNYLPTGAGALLYQVRRRPADGLPSLQRIPFDPGAAVFPPEYVVSATTAAAAECPSALPKGIFCFPTSFSTKKLGKGLGDVKQEQHCSSG